MTRKQEVRKETLDNIIRDLIPDVWKREATKMSLDKIHDAQFDLRYEELMKSKGQAITHEMKKHTLADLQVRNFQEHNDIVLKVRPR